MGRYPFIHLGPTRIIHAEPFLLELRTILFSSVLTIKFFDGVSIQDALY
jgi:hypothetical protein